MAIKEQLIKLNPWWKTKQVSEELLKPFARIGFNNYLDSLNNKRILCLTGLRRSGKSTLMYQLINHLLDRTDPKRILYLIFNLKELKESGIKNILAEYAELNNLDLKKQETYVFLDEIHYVKDWSFELKEFYDLGYPIKFIVSGSSSINLYKVSSESLVGRIGIKHLYPFSLKEYLTYYHPECKSLPNNFDLLWQIKNYQKQFLLYQTTITKLFLQYLLKGAIPEQFEEGSFNNWQNWLRQDYVSLTLHRDILDIYGLYDAKALEDLLSIIASQSSQRFSYLSLAKNLGLKKDTVKRYLFYLKTASLIYEADFFTKSISKIARKNKKFYLADTGLINAVLYNNELIDESFVGHLVETVVQLHLRIFLTKRFGLEFPNLYYWQANGEIDFVLDLKKELVPIEVKYRKKITKEDIKTMHEFFRKFKSKRGIIVTKNTWKREGKILFIPAWVFLLML